MQITNVVKGIFYFIVLYYPLLGICQDKAGIHFIKAGNWQDVLSQAKKSNKFIFVDAYANLFYKLGRNKEAIEWEQKALAASPEQLKSGYRATLEKMRKGEST